MKNFHFFNFLSNEKLRKVFCVVKEKAAKKKKIQFEMMLNSILLIFQEKITHFFFLEKNKMIHVLGEGKIFRRQPNTIHFVMQIYFLCKKI